MKNKLFFFGNYDRARKLTPIGFSADGSASQQFANPTLARQVLEVTKQQYGYDAGNLAEISRPNDSDKVFGRTDFNLNSRNQLTFRVNYVDASFWSGSQSTNTYNLPSHFYTMTDKMLSSVVQLNSSFGQAFNEFRVTYSRERNNRGLAAGVLGVS